MQKTSGKFCLIKELFDSDFTKIPNKKGIYIVKKPQNMEIIFLSTPTALHNNHKKCTSYTIDQLSRKFIHTDQEILYIGKAGGNNSTLRKRIKQLIKHGLGLSATHCGGRAIWQIKSCENLLLEFWECEYPEEAEKILLFLYYKKWGVLPVANWKIG